MTPYNNYFPTTYQNPVGYSQYMQPQVPQSSFATPPISQQSNSGIIWVQGEAAAKAYPVAPGNSVLLMDSEEQRFFIKSADASGMPLPLRRFSYTEEVEVQQSYANAPDVDMSQYITRKEFDEWRNEQMTHGKKGDKNA